MEKALTYQQRKKGRQGKGVLRVLGGDLSDQIRSVTVAVGCVFTGFFNGVTDIVCGIVNGFTGSFKRAVIVITSLQAGKAAHNQHENKKILEVFHRNFPCEN
jgi:hypothetical protein